MNALSKNKTIDARITSLRAFAILAVVFGHSIILYSDSWGLYQSVHDVPVFNTIKQIINLFQMPLFFSISGFLFSMILSANIIVLTSITDGFDHLSTLPSYVWQGWQTTKRAFQFVNRRLPFTVLNVFCRFFESSSILTSLFVIQKAGSLRLLILFDFSTVDEDFCDLA